MYVFNVAGYQLAFSFIIERSDKSLIQHLDRENYDEHQLFEVKVPLNLPYYNHQTAYERINGEVNYKGVYYNYLKRKIAGDTLYILCLKNKTKTKLQRARIDLAKAAVDAPAEKNTSTKKVNLLGEHDSLSLRYELISVAQNSIQFGSTFTSALHSAFSGTKFRPPETRA